MPRRRWTDVPTEWVQIVRGHRPKSEQWPLAPGHSARRSEAARPGQGRLSQPVNRPLTKVQSLEAALEALGPEDSTAKTEIQAALQRAKAASPPAPRVQCTPDAAKEAARMKIRLEKALEVLQPRQCCSRMHANDWHVWSNELQPFRQCQRQQQEWQTWIFSRQNWRKPKLRGTNSGAGNDGQLRPPIIRPHGTECPDSSNARRRAGVVRLVARQTHRSQGCPRIWDTERDSANDIHGGRWCRQAGRIHDHGDHVKGGRIQQRFCGGGRDSRYGLRGVRVGEESNPCPVQTRQARRAHQLIADRRVLVREDEPLQDTVQDSMSTTRSRRRRRRLRPLPWSWDSDSELDGPVLTPHARRRTEVCHDTHIDVSSEEPLVRSNIGRDVIARTQVSGTCNAESHIRSTVRESNVLSAATQDRVLSDDRQMLETMQPGTATWRDQDSIDDNGVDATVPATSGALRAAGVTEFAPPTSVRRLAHNRFFSLATESEDEQTARRTTIHEETSDTMSLIGIRNSRRPLRLRWSEHAPSTANVPGNVLAGAPHEPDSHDMRLVRVREALQRDGQPPEVRRAVEAVRSLAARIGQVDPEGGVPRVIRRQQWSVFNVPLVWAAAAGDRSCAVLEWLAQFAMCPSQCVAWRCLGTRQSWQGGKHCIWQ